MKKIFLLLLMTCVLASCGQKEDIIVNKNTYLNVHDQSEYNTDTYYLDVFLDEADNTLTVTGELIYFNDEQPYEELYLMFYPNAHNPKEEGFNVDIEYISINHKAVNYEFVGYDTTSMLIEFEEPLEKDENIRISFKYRFTYWTFDRIMHQDNDYLTMFFYPFVALYDEDGWHNDEYTFFGESYNNELGDYYVSINVPNDYQIAASGLALNTTELDNRKRVDYYLGNARDFSFSASASYVYYHQQIGDISVDIYSLGGLETEEQTQMFQVVEDSFRVFEDYIGPYDQTHFTVEFGHFFGMESTGVVYCSRELSEGTVVHEILHQWLYSMIGSNQSEESFVDESLTTYLAFLYFYEVYGNVGRDEYLGFRDSRQERLEEHYLATEGTNMIRRVNQYGEEYAYIIYYHGPTLLRVYVETYLNNDYATLRSIINGYYDTFYGEIVSLDEFLDYLELSSGVDGTKAWFLGQFEAIKIPITN